VEIRLRDGSWSGETGRGGVSSGSSPGTRRKPIDLSAIKLNDWVADVFAEFAIEQTSTGTGRKLRKYMTSEGDQAQRLSPAASKQRVAAAQEFQRARRGKGARVVTPQLIKEAAEVYKAHFDDRPIQAVTAAFGVSERTASGWITKARREHHYLPETKRGKKAK
jgi:hypothetical protein